MAEISKSTSTEPGGGAPTDTFTKQPYSVVIDSDTSPRQKTKSSLWRRIVGLIWDSVEGDERNRKYVVKLDNFLFSYICMGYFIKYLDQQNYSNAYVSGMREDLQLFGNERNWLVTYFNLGIIIGTIPSQMIQLKYIRPSIWIPACEVSWSILVMAMAGAKNVETLYALRFFVGLLEACSFPGYASLLGGWYGPKELNKRVAIFEQTSAIAAMFSGYLQTALHKGMNGKHGLAGWQWLFIMDGVISIPIAVWGFFAIPDLPHTTKAFYWTEDDKKYGVERIEKIGRGAPRQLTLKVIRDVYTNWRLWVFIIPYLFVAQSGSGTNYFNLYLKAEKYSVSQANILPTAGNAIAVVAAFFFGILADRTGQRLWMIIIVQILVLISNILLTIWNIPKGALLFAFYLSYTGAAAQPIVISWGHELNGADPNLRQLLVATGNIFTYTFSMFIPLVLFRTQDAPIYPYGYQVLILFGGLAVFGAFILEWQDRRENPRSKGQRRRSQEDDETPVNESDESSEIVSSTVLVTKDIETAHGSSPLRIK